jgi:integrase
MATSRKRRRRWEVQIRREGHRPFSKSFYVRKDAEAWARQKEVEADRHELGSDPRLLQRVTLADLIKRYRDTVSIRKRTAAAEQIYLNAFLRDPICRKRISDLSVEHFVAYRDKRLKKISPSGLKRALVPIRNLFKIARNEWGLPIRENPLDKLQLKAPDQRRERRLRDGELERLIKSAKSCRNPLVAPIIQLAIETGMRRGEILAIRKTQLDSNRRNIGRIL